MSWWEAALVGGAVLFALFMVVKQFVRPFGKAKGSCRACGEVCGCEARNDAKPKA